MAPKSLPLLFVLLSILSALIPNEAAAGDIVGGWKPADPRDPEVVKIANFAVTEHNKEAKTGLVFASVVKAETQVVAGTNYRVVLTAKDGGAAEPKNYRAVVWSKPWEKFLKLVSFEPIEN